MTAGKPRIARGSAKPPERAVTPTRPAPWVNPKARKEWLDAGSVAETARLNGMRTSFVRKLLREQYRRQDPERFVIANGIGQMRFFFDVRDGIFTTDLDSATAFQDRSYARAILQLLGPRSKIMKARLLRSGRLVLGPAAKR